MLETVQLDVAYAVMMLGDTNVQFEAARGLLDLASESLEAMRQSRVEATRERLARALWRNAAIGGVAALAAIALAVVTGRLIASPVVNLTAVMGRLAQRDTGIVVPHIGRRDEIGCMARAVEVFRTSMIDADRLAAERDREREARIAMPLRSSSGFTPSKPRFRPW